MRKRKKSKYKKLPCGLYLVYIICIATINIAGISYAAWSDGLSIEGSIGTGNMTPHFINEYTVKQKQGNGQINVSFEDRDGDGYNEIMYVEGEIEEGSSGFIKCGIQNEGTIPIKYQKIKGHGGEKDVYLNSLRGVLKPDEKRFVKIDIDDLMIQEDGEQNLTIPFIQWTQPME